MVFAMKIIVDKESAPPLPFLLAQRHGETKETFIHGLLVLEDTVWAATNKGVGRWKRSTGAYGNVTTAHGLASNAVSGICQRNDGTLWVSTYDNGLCTLNEEGHWISFTENQPFDSKRIQTLCHTADDSLWMSNPRKRLSARCTGRMAPPRIRWGGLNLRESRRRALVWSL